MSFPRIRTASACLILAFLLPLTACRRSLGVIGGADGPTSIFVTGGGSETASDEPSTVSFLAMDTLMAFTVYGPQELAWGARDVILDFEAQLSATNPQSAVSQINAEGSGAVSRDAARLLYEALNLCRETEGRLDLSIYPIVRAWGFTTDENRIPADAELADLLDRVDYRRIALTRLDGSPVTEAALSEDDQFLVTLPEGMEIDLGAVAKGCAGTMAAAYLRQNGVTSALLNLGGNIQTVGRKPDGSPWRVAVQDPALEGLAGVLEADGLAVVTSGGYQRYFTGDDGTVYWHIMDPRTGRPARSGLLSATIAAEDGTLCDALSTALFVMGEEEAVDFWRARQDFGMVLITEDGRLLVTPDLAFEALDESGYTPEVLPR